VRFSKPVALLVLLATLVPLSYLVFFFGIIVSSFTGGPTPEDFGLYFVLLHLSQMAWCLGLLGFYVVALFKSRNVPQDQKALWAVVLFFLHIFAMLVFWWLYIWPRSDPET
jgi:hypothetical protein